MYAVSFNVSQSNVKVRVLSVFVRGGFYRNFNFFSEIRAFFEVVIFPVLVQRLLIFYILKKSTHTFG